MGHQEIRVDYKRPGRISQTTRGFSPTFIHFSKAIFLTPGWKGALPALSGTESGGKVSPRNDSPLPRWKVGGERNAFPKRQAPPHPKKELPLHSANPPKADFHPGPATLSSLSPAFGGTGQEAAVLPWLGASLLPVWQARSFFPLSFGGEKVEEWKKGSSRPLVPPPAGLSPSRLNQNRSSNPINWVGQEGKELTFWHKVVIH